MLYNHAYTLSFSLISQDKKASSSAQQLRNAILKRLTELTDRQLVEACSEPFDTFESKKVDESALLMLAKDMGGLEGLQSLKRRVEIYSEFIGNMS